MKTQRDVYQVWKILDRRYSVGDALRETFLDHECIHVLETLLSYGPDSCDAQSYKELENAAGDIDLEAARFGAYSEFLAICEEHGIDGSKAWDQFSNAHAYWGDNLESYEVIDRAGDVAASYVKQGKKLLAKIRN